MQEIEQTEAVLDNERSTLKEHIGQIVEEEKELRDQLQLLEKQLAQKERELKAEKRDWERKIDAQQNAIQSMQSCNDDLEKQIEKEKKKVADHHMTKLKDNEYMKLQQELENMEKNNKMLKIIEVQYQREIERRNKREEQAKLEQEIGEKILDSPLRRAREYAQTIAGSPSPIKRIVTRGQFKFEISPEKTEVVELRQKADC